MAGVLQGAAGISAPVSITFLNAMRLKRESFIAAISVLFATFSLVQIPVAIATGLVRGNEFVYGLLALVPLSLAMPLGAMIARRMTPSALDRLILAVLCVLAGKLVFDSVF